MNAEEEASASGPVSAGPGAGRPVTPRTGLPAVDAVLDDALGRGHRHDPVLPGSGGPAGNARLTAWTGLLLLVVIAAELVTLLDVTGLIRWHVGVGILLTALALLKTASTSWRIGRYYTGATPYVRAGPPPLLLRLLGPLVVGSTLGVLGSGIALIALGPQADDRASFTALGHPVSPLTLHQGFFILFAVLAGLHLLARAVPAFTLSTGRTAHGGTRRPVPGRRRRGAGLLAALLAGAVATALVLPTVTGWHHRGHDHPNHPNRTDRRGGASTPLRAAEDTASQLST